MDPSTLLLLLLCSCDRTRIRTCSSGHGVNSGEAMPLRESTEAVNGLPSEAAERSEPLTVSRTARCSSSNQLHGDCRGAWLPRLIDRRPNAVRDQRRGVHRIDPLARTVDLSPGSLGASQCQRRCLGSIVGSWSRGSAFGKDRLTTVGGSTFWGDCAALVALTVDESSGPE